MALNDTWENVEQEQVAPELQAAVFADLLLNQFTGAAFCLDENAQFRYVNAAFCNLVEFSREELLAMTLYDLNRALSTQIWTEQCQALKQRSLTKHDCYYTRGNQIIQLELTLSYVEHQGQALICVFAHESPTQALPPLEFETGSTVGELEASLALLNATLESTAVGIVAIGADKSAFYFNQIFAEMWQLPTSVPITRECDRARAFFENQVKDPEIFHKAIWQVSTLSESESYDVVELKDGRIFAHYAKPQRLNGKVIGRVWSVWNITKFKQAEEALQEQALRPTDLLADQITLEQTKQLNELKGRFISVICHQFRSLLNIISFSNSLVQRHVNRWTDDKKQPYLEHIQIAVDQITQLLDEILLFGKSTVGKLESEPTSLDVATFCCDLISQMQTIGDCRQQTIAFTCPEPCSAVIDPKLLQPILSNILSNAMKYSPEGSTIHFKLLCQDQSITFEIQDSGIGIPATDQLRLFEPFYRGSNVGDAPGTGLGLATVKNLVDLQGGQIALTSDAGVGTTVVISLPIAPSIDSQPKSLDLLRS